MCIKSFSFALHNKSTRVRVQAWPAVKKRCTRCKATRRLRRADCPKCNKHTAQGFVPCSKRLIDWDAFDREPSRQATPLSGRMVMFSESRSLEHSLMVKWFMYAARDQPPSRCMFLPDSWRTWDYCKWCTGYFQKAEECGVGSAHTNHCSVFSGGQ